MTKKELLIRSLVSIKEQHPNVLSVEQSEAIDKATECLKTLDKESNSELEPDSDKESDLEKIGLVIEALKLCFEGGSLIRLMLEYLHNR